MSLISYRNLTVSFGGPFLLDNVGVTIERKQRICLLGRNGEGKSTLLRILAEQIKPDGGQVERMDGFRVAKLDQEIPVGVGGTVFDLVAKGLGSEANLLREYNLALQELGENPQDEKLGEEVDRLQSELDRTDGWSLDYRIASVIDRVGLNPMKLLILFPVEIRAAMLARALVSEPHLLIWMNPPIIWILPVFIG